MDPKEECLNCPCKLDCEYQEDDDYCPQEQSYWEEDWFNNW